MAVFDFNFYDGLKESYNYLKSLINEIRNKEI